MGGTDLTGLNDLLKNTDESAAPESGSSELPAMPPLDDDMAGIPGLGGDVSAAEGQPSPSPEATGEGDASVEFPDLESLAGNDEDSPEVGSDASGAAAATGPSADPSSDNHMMSGDLPPIGELSGLIDSPTGGGGDAESAPGESASPAPSPSPSPSPSGAATLESVKNYSAQVVPGKNLVPAAFPFSLMIEGTITPHEREKITDLMAREKIGITEVDLEPQFESGRILIPRISEYAGILIIQALRGVQAHMRLAPSDQIFSTEDTRDSPEEALRPSDEREHRISFDRGHPAESLPITRDRILAEMAQFQVIDTISVSAVLRTTVVDAEHSTEYEEIMEGLQRELKYKAHYRGAQAITQFTVQLIPLGLASHYRLTLMGQAIRPLRAPQEPRA